MGAEVAEQQVLLHRQVRHDALATPVLGDEADAGADRLGRRARRERLALEREDAAGALPQAEYATPASRTVRPRPARRGRESRRDGDRTRRRAPAAARLRFRRERIGAVLLAAAAERAAKMAPSSRPTIRRISSGWLSELVSTEAATVRPSRRTVRRSAIANTSSSRCETKMTAHPDALRRAMTSNSRSTSPGLSEAVGSSKMMRLALSASALAISTSWRCAAESWRTSASSGRVRCCPSSVRISFGAPPHQRVGQTPGPAERRQEDVFGDRQIGREAGLLHHHRDADVQRLARRPQIEWLSLVGYGAFVAPHMSRDDARQRRFAGAVGAEQRMRLPGGKHEIGPGERPRSSEDLGDVASFEKDGIG